MPKKKGGKKGGKEVIPASGISDADYLRTSEDVDDLADQLFASLNAEGTSSADAVPPSATAGPVDIPSAAPSHAPSSPHSHRSPSEVLSNMKQAGKDLFHSKSPSGSTMMSPPPPPADPSLSPSSGSRIRAMFGGSKSPDAASDAAGGSSEANGKKVSRQKARLQRKTAQQAAEREKWEAELKANGGQPDLADEERVGLSNICKVLKLEMHEISPDGHCLYSAIADQLSYRSKVPKPVDYRETRRVTAHHMRSHPDDFIPFVSDIDEKMAGITSGADGERETEQTRKDHYLSYCDAIEKTAVWGGQPEILALSRAYETQIHVVQSGVPVLKVGEGEQDALKPLTISYHRRMYGLGEHYNSLRDAK